jgi:hypothetical protein
MPCKTFLLDLAAAASDITFAIAIRNLDIGHPFVSKRMVRIAQMPHT